MSINITDNKGFNETGRPFYAKIEVTLRNGEKLSYHGTYHKEGDGSYHIVADTGVRKKQGVGFGFWNGEFKYSFGNGGKYRNEVIQIFKWFEGQLHKNFPAFVKKALPQRGGNLIYKIDYKDMS